MTTDAERITEIRRKLEVAKQYIYTLTGEDGQVYSVAALDDIEWLLTQLDAANAEIAELRCQCQDKYAPRVWALEAENVRLRELITKMDGLAMSGEWSGGQLSIEAAK